MSAFVDKIKNLFRGKQESAEGAVDKTSEATKDTVGHDEQVDSVAENAKEHLGEQAKGPEATPAPGQSGTPPADGGPGSTEESR